MINKSLAEFCLFDIIDSEYLHLFVLFTLEKEAVCAIEDSRMIYKFPIQKGESGYIWLK